MEKVDAVDLKSIFYRFESGSEYNKMLIKIKIKAYDKNIIEQYIKNISAYCSYMNIKKLNMKHFNLPFSSTLYTVLKSPHIDKKARNQYEMRLYKKTIALFLEENPKNNIVDINNNLIKFLKLYAVGININIFFRIKRISN